MQTAAVSLLFVATIAADGPILPGSIPPLTEEERAAAVDKWKAAYDAEMGRLKEQYKKAKADTAFPITRDQAKQEMKVVKEAISKLEKNRLAALPKLGVMVDAEGTGSKKTADRKYTQYTGVSDQAKKGEVGIFADPNGKIIRSDASGTLLVVNGKRTTSYATRRGESAGRVSVAEPVRVIVVPAIKGADPGKTVQLTGLWHTADIVAIDGTRMAVFQRIEVKPGEGPK